VPIVWGVFFAEQLQNRWYTEDVFELS